MHMVGHDYVGVKLELVEQLASEEHLHHNSGKLFPVQPKGPCFSPMEDAVHRHERRPGGELLLGELPFPRQTAGEAKRNEQGNSIRMPVRQPAPVECHTSLVPTSPTLLTKTRLRMLR
jgi:hypothetical protein